MSHSSYVWKILIQWSYPVLSVWASSSNCLTKSLLLYMQILRECDPRNDSFHHKVFDPSIQSWAQAALCVVDTPGHLVRPWGMNSGQDHNTVLGGCVMR